MNMPQLTPGHARFEYFAGTWQGPENMRPSRWTPEGFTATGRNTGRVALNGFAMILDYQQEKDGVVTFTGHGVLTYDPHTDTYQMTWFDCLGTAPEFYVGTFAGKVLTLASDRQGFRSRLTYDFSRPGRWLGRMETSPDGANWDLMFDAVYTKI